MSDRHTDRHTEKQTDKFADRLMNGETDRRKHRQKKRRMDFQTKVETVNMIFKFMFFIQAQGWRKLRK